jgi:YHS domain-containing protein
MLRILLIGLLLMLIARAFWRVVDGVIAGATGQPSGGRARTPPMKLVRDPVCGTFVTPTTERSLTAGGQTHYFCSEECRSKFHA